MAGLPDLLAWLDNRRRVAGRNLSDLIQNPAGTFEQIDDRAKNYNQNVQPTIQGGQLSNRPLTEEEKQQQSIDMAMNFMGGGVGSIKGIVGAGRTAAPQAEALRLAQQRAALPVERYGLGLPANNTPQMRADAMFPVDAYHGSGGKDFPVFDIAKSGATTKAKNTDSTVFASAGPKTAINYIEPSWEQMVDAGLLPKNIDPHNLNISELLKFKENPAFDAIQKRHLLEMNDSANKVTADLGEKTYFGGRFVETSKVPVLLEKYGPLKITPLQHMPEYSQIPNSEIGKAVQSLKRSIGKQQSIEMAAELGGNPRVMPLRINTDGFQVKDFKGKARQQGDFADVLGKTDKGAVFRNTYDGSGLDTIYGIKNPDDIRSRFAAFDPWRRNAAIAAAMGVAAPDLLAAENDGATRSLKDLMQQRTE